MGSVAPHLAPHIVALALSKVTHWTLCTANPITAGMEANLDAGHPYKAAPPTV